MKTNLIKLLSSTSLLLATLMFAPASHATVQLDLQNGILMGANGINVNGAIYNVAFEDGSCDSLYNNCDTSLFGFHNYADATAASVAVVKQIFLNSFFGGTGAPPSRINGCVGTTKGCFAMTLYGQLDATDYEETNAYASTNPYYDLNGAGLVFAGSDTSPDVVATYAVWDRVSNSVPEPASLSLLGIGLIGLGISRKRKTKARVE